VIIGFKHKGLEKFFGKEIKSEIQAKHAERLRLILGRFGGAEPPPHIKRHSRENRNEHLSR